MQPETAVTFIFGLIILGGVTVIVSGMRYRSRLLEMAHRERLAMIERGLTPQGELGGVSTAPPAGRSSRLLSLGIVIVGLGLGLAALIGFASREPEIATGVGGAIVILGAAFIVVALVVHRPAPATDDFYSPSRSGFERPTAPPPLTHRDPPAS